MFANRSCEMNFWRDTESLFESDFDVASAVPARVEGPKATVNFRMRPEGQASPVHAPMVM